jgi:hypothetical protein
MRQEVVNGYEKESQPGVQARAVKMVQDRGAALKQISHSGCILLALIRISKRAISDRMS